MMVGKDPLIIPQDEEISCSHKTGDLFGGSHCPPDLVPPRPSPIEMHLLEWWKLEKSRIDWGSQGDSVWLCCFNTSVSPVSPVVSPRGETEPCHFSQFNPSLSTRSLEGSLCCLWWFQSRKLTSGSQHSH